MAIAIPPSPRLDYVFMLRVNFGHRTKIGPLPSGFVRGFTNVVGGTISGPRLNGDIVPHSGGDWPAYWPGGAVEFSARYMLRADDGTLIALVNRGYRHASPAVTERMERLDPVAPDEYYMRLAPSFEAPVGPHDWLNRTVFVGTADRRTDHSLFHFWAVA